MASPKVYLDTCIVSGIAREDLPQAEQEAVATLLQLYKARRVDLVTSDVAKSEIDHVPEQFRSRHETIYFLLKDVPVARAEWTDSGLTLTGVGGGRREDPLYTDLRLLLPDEADAQHVFQAIRADADYFATTDVKTILRFAKALHDQHQLVAALPTDCVSSIAASSLSE
jgi:hypothetical protein